MERNKRFKKWDAIFSLPHFFNFDLNLNIYRYNQIGESANFAFSEYKPRTLN